MNVMERVKMLRMKFLKILSKVDDCLKNFFFELVVWEELWYNRRNRTTHESFVTVLNIVIFWIGNEIEVRRVGVRIVNDWASNYYFEIIFNMTNFLMMSENKS